MDLFDALHLIGGLCLFLYGMSLMGTGLERTAGSRLERMLGKLTSGRLAGLLTGLAVTAVIQSSSATTVMVVGFVNSGLMNLKQAIHVIMGANIGTTVTAWLLSLGGISGDSLFVQLLKPSSFTPILALAGLILFLFSKSNRKKDAGTIFLGFAILIFGMDTMTGAVAGLADEPGFQNAFLMFKNPVLGVLVGAVFTAIIQSSSASVGILQALAATGAVSYGAAIPIIMGQNIGTCITAIIASVGTNKNARRASLVHLSFNVIGTVVWLAVFLLVRTLWAPALFDQPATMAGIAVAHSLFNIGCTALLLPMTGLLEKLAYRLIPEGKKAEEVTRLDERLLSNPAVALEQAEGLTREMAELAFQAVRDAISCLRSYDAALADRILAAEEQTDRYEDIIGTYLVKLSTQSLSEKEGAKTSMLLKIIGDLERTCDHAVNLLDSAKEMQEKRMAFTPAATAEMERLWDATLEILALTHLAFAQGDENAAACVEPLEQVIDQLKAHLRSTHIQRLRRGECSMEAGFVWGDLLTNLERISDHCSNIAGCLLEDNPLALHENLRQVRRDSPVYAQKYETYLHQFMDEL